MLESLSPHEAVSRSRSSRRVRAEELRARERRLVDALAFSERVQRDYARKLEFAPVALGFTAVSVYGAGASPLTLPGASSLESWHLSTKGLVLAPALIKSNPAGPNVNWDNDVSQSVPFRLDILSTGARGVATYGLTIDAGLSYFQTGVTAVTVPVPLFGRTLIFDPGTYTITDNYVGVCKSMANQTAKTRTLNGAATDSSKPIVQPNAKNGYPCLTSTGGTSGGMTDVSSSWAVDVASGNRRPMTWFLVMAPDSAAPSAVRAFFSFGNTAAANPAYYFSSRNGVNNYRAGHIVDGGTATNRDGGALDTNFHVYTILQDAAGNSQIWDNGVSIAASATWGTAVDTTLNCAALFALFRNSAQTNNCAHRFLEITTYSSSLSTNDRETNQSYYLGKYAI